MQAETRISASGQRAETMRELHDYCFRQHSQLHDSLLELSPMRKVTCKDLGLDNATTDQFDQQGPARGDVSGPTATLLALCLTSIGVGGRLDLPTWDEATAM